MEETVVETDGEVTRTIEERTVDDEGIERRRIEEVRWIRVSLNLSDNSNIWWYFVRYY